MFYHVGLVQNILKKVDMPIPKSSGAVKLCCRGLNNYQCNGPIFLTYEVSYTSNIPENHAVMFRPINEAFVDTGIPTQG